VPDSLDEYTRMALIIYLVSLLALLIGCLVWRRIPRRAAFDIVHYSVWIFALTAFLSLELVDRVAPQFLNGLAPFIPPVIPVGIFVAWSLKGGGG
jgi:hypothetical protein